MVGRKVEQLYPERPIGTDEVLLEVRDVRRLPAVRGVSLKVHAGEVVGLGGLVGSGRTELLRLVYGLDQPEGGKVFVGGEPLRASRPRQAIRQGLGLAPEDRKSQALILDWSETKNVTIADLDRFSHVLLDIREERARARDQLRSLNTVPDDPDRVVRLLSGGNQQKVVIAREVSAQPKLMLVGQPTRGVDIGTIESIHTQLLKMRDDGVAILLVSVELEEVRALADRIIVMSGGRITGELNIEEFDTTRIGLLMGGMHTS
jgi:ABC-type sugar transport system ATPase subunit